MNLYWITQNIIFILAGLVLVCLAALAVFYVKLHKKIKMILGGLDSDDATFSQDIARRLTQMEIKLEALEPRVDLLDNSARVSVQKVGFKRYNPFQDTGGDNSFMISLLDKENNGMIISSLYTRENSRVYAKEITNGAPKHHLSEEEENLLEETKKK